ncbi:uncharacterized protein LOC118457638 isoform X2 [Anopheles albimanus]|uniref:uncharacterized protein LOC118457638 isoform X2 n=1 Tax=Anopheles albimanus TaxID=7167 RepID=UPI0016406DFA|nr:uncharacterized protein LOC118457638 isoform X2 [Anopheles albimanus]
MFLILEIVNDKGGKEWKVAPKRWVCTSKNTQRTVLFWPNEISVERQTQLAIEGTCKPLKSWMRKECVIKCEFPTYEAANNELQKLLAQHINQINEEPVDPLTIEDPAVESFESPTATVPDKDASALANIKSMLQSLITKNSQIEQQYSDLVEHNTRIESIISLMQKGLDTVESKFTNTLSVLRLGNSWHKPEEAIYQENDYEETFSFEPMETIEQLTLLDIRLNDESFNAELVQWLCSNIYTDNTRKRIICCMELLCSFKLLLEMKWASLVDQHNFLILIKTIGDTPSNCITLSSVGDFLKYYLTHSKKRFHNSLNRNISPANRTIKKRQENANSSKRNFVFKPRETAEELRELEMKLNDELFNAELLKWLLFNVKDDNAQWRIKSCLDLLCSLELQSKLSSREDTVRRYNS